MGNSEGEPSPSWLLIEEPFRLEKSWGKDKTTRNVTETN